MFFLFPRLEHPAGWICARYKSLLLLLIITISLLAAMCLRVRNVTPLFCRQWSLTNEIDLKTTRDGLARHGNVKEMRVAVTNEI